MYSFSATDGGKSAAGSFTFDAMADQESAISITISGAGNGLDGVYTQAGPIMPPSRTPTFFTSASDIIVGISGAIEAWIGFAAPLTSVGGTISVFGAGSPDVFSLQTGPGFENGSATAIVGVPEPASFAVLGVGILGLVGLGQQSQARYSPRHAALSRASRPLAFRSASRRPGAVPRRPEDIPSAPRG